MIPPSFILEGLKDDALCPHRPRPEAEQPNSRMKVKVEQLSSGCRLYMPQCWRQGVSKGIYSTPGHSSKRQS
jgi:hypothetical protein